jgi:hypothetical protein
VAGTQWQLASKTLSLLPMLFLEQQVAWQTCQMGWEEDDVDVVTFLDHKYLLFLQFSDWFGEPQFLAQFTLIFMVETHFEATSV